MPRPSKFYFVPVRNEDLRKKKEEEKAVKPYVRIQKPGLLVFPKKTLEHFGLKVGDLAYLRFYIDQSRRALAFKFIDRMRAEEFKELRPMKITKYGDYPQGIVSIRSILLEFKAWPMPLKCDIETYTGQDEMVHFGELNYIVIPRVEKEEVTESPE